MISSFVHRLGKENMQRSKLVLWSMIGLIVLMLIGGMSMVGYRKYLEAKVYVTEGMSQLVYEADYKLQYEKSHPRSHLYLQRAYANAARGQSLEVVLKDYENAKKASPRFFVNSSYAIQLPLMLATKGRYKECVEIFEEELPLVTNVPTDEAAYKEYLEATLAETRHRSTFEEFKKKAPLNLSSKVRYAYARFLATTKNASVRDPKRGVEMAKKLVAEECHTYNLFLLAHALAADGQFSKAMVALEACEEAYKKESNPHPTFLERLGRDRQKLIKKLPILDQNY